jgi:hypothetical protein
LKIAAGAPTALASATLCAPPVQGNGGKEVLAGHRNIGIRSGEQAFGFLNVRATQEQVGRKTAFHMRDLHGFERTSRDRNLFGCVAAQDRQRVGKMRPLDLERGNRRFELGDEGGLLGQLHTRDEPMLLLDTQTLQYAGRA